MNTEVSRFLIDLFASSEVNRLPDAYGGHRLFKAPIIGVAAGNDQLFQIFKEVVGPAHLTPAEMWSKSAAPRCSSRGTTDNGRPRPEPGTWSDLADLSEQLKVLSIVFPYTEPILEDGCRSTRRTPLAGLALHYAHRFHAEVNEQLVRYIIGQGYRVMVPQLSHHYSVLLRCGNPPFIATWSERHVAFAAGLGTFGLAEHLITEQGCNVRLASIISDIPLTITPRKSDDPYGNCLHYTQGGCAQCVARCPGQALTEHSHSKVLCEIARQKTTAGLRRELSPFLEPVARRFMYLPVKDKPIGCAICQYDVPCMARNPMADDV
ncbi:hypothetical protein ACFL3H_05150 [Gemmatimonadota bacterium]